MPRCHWLVLPLVVITAGWSPALSAPVPIRQVGDQSDWSTPPAALQRLVNRGEIRDRGLLDLLKHAGWPTEDLRLALAKTYRVDHLSLARFLSSERGEQFLQRHLGTYGPEKAPQAALVGLRSAILAASADGLMSAMEVLAQLPTDFDLRRSAGPGGAAMPVCGSGDHMGGERSSSWLSWIVFLPACLQAASAPAPPAALKPATGR